MKEKNNVWIIISVVLALGVIISSLIMTNGFVQVKADKDTLTVKGSAKKEIKSDLVVWSGSFSSESVDLKDAYNRIKDSQNKVEKYLIDEGISKDEIVFSSINTIPINRILPSGAYSNEIDRYKLQQTVEIRSKEIDKITEISRKATDIINEGVSFRSNMPQYFYTKLSDLKVDMIGLATEDSKKRAEKMLSTTGNSVGQLKSARVGVFQITPLYSNEISDYGINDTTSIDKEITAVVECEFEVK